MKKIVVIGGGTGSHTVLSGLKNYPLKLTSIVTVADSGGSTGRLRDEFGYLPMADFRMALVALADSDRDNTLLRQLFMYRFNRGEEGLKGHNFGNLFLVAMTDILGSEDKAIEFASKVLRVKGEVLPVTTGDVELIAEYEDGKIIQGETNIDEPAKDHDGTLRIVNLRLEPKAKVSLKAEKAIYEADLIILGPGDFYTSLLANVVVDGVPECLKNTKANLIYIVNLMTKYGQTYGFTVKDHLEELKKYVGKCPDFIFVNTTPLPWEILQKYEEERGFPVEDDLEESEEFKIVRTDLLAAEEVKKPSGDVLKRSLIRHDGDKLAWEIMKIINS